MYKLFLFIFTLIISINCSVSHSQENLHKTKVFFEENVMSFEYGYLNGYFNLPKDAILNNGNLNLNISTTVNSITEFSEMIVYINGVEKSKFNLIGGSNNKKYIIKVDDDIKIGLNKVSLEFNHRNRFSCNIEDIYDLWSKIEKSEFEYVSDQSSNNTFFISDFYNEILSSGNTNSSIALLFPSDTIDSNIITFSSLISQGVKVRSIYKSPIIRNKELDISNLENLNIIVGIKDDISDIYKKIDVPNILFDNIKGPSVLSGTIDNKKILFLTAKNVSDLKTLILKFSSKNMNFPFSSYYNIDTNKKLSYDFNINNNISLKENIKYSFNDIGIPDIIHNHIFNNTIMKFNLPSNILSIPSDKVVMNLTGKYLSNLSSNSRFEIYLNSNLVNVLLLNNIEGESFNNYKLYIPVKYLKPYENEIKFISKINQYGPCFNYIDSNNKKDYLYIDSKLSNIKIPNYSEIIHLPNLSFLYSSSTPYYLNKKNNIYLFERNWSDLDFASNILADIAKNSNKVSFYEGDILPNETGILKNNSLFFGGINSIPDSYFEVDYLNKDNIKNSFLSFDKIELKNDLIEEENILLHKYNHYKDLLYKDSFLESYSKSNYVTSNKLGAIFQRKSLYEDNKVWTFYMYSSDSIKDNFIKIHNKGKIFNSIKEDLSLITLDEKVFNYSSNNKYYLFIDDYNFKNIKQMLSNYIDNNLLKSIIIIVLLLIFLGGTTYFFVKKIGNNK